MPIRFLITVLLCSGAAFVLGWSLRDMTAKGADGAPEVRSTPNLPSGHATEMPAASSPRPAGSEVTSPLPPSPVDDHSHEIEVVHDPFMPHGGAYPPGSSEDKEIPDSTVTVGSTVKHDGPTVVRIERRWNFGFLDVELVCDPATNRIEASVENEGDTRPAPPRAWEDVSGRIWASSMVWGEGGAVTLDYVLYGLQGGYRRCTHGRVFVDL